MKEPIQVPVIVAGLQTKVDGSVKITLETGELNNDQAGELYGMRNCAAWAVIAPDSIKEMNIPKEEVDPALGSKTPSQRLRNVIFVYWKEKGSNGDFDDFYKKQLEFVIEQYKEKLS
jgi:hypothetical protein